MKLNYCFQQQENVHKLYIYDDISKFGKFNWATYTYEESKTSANYFREQLEAIPETDEIELHINSNGGSVNEGVTIYNQLKQKKCVKKGYVDGAAYSIAFVILQACDTRIMGVGTSALIHNIWMTVSGNAQQLRKAADDLDVLMEANRKIFLQRSKLTEDQLKEMMEKETFLTPDQCLEYGLIDEIGDYATQGEEDDQLQYLKDQVSQLKGIIAAQKSFREVMAEMAGAGQEPRGAAPAGAGQEPPAPEKTLMSKLAGCFGL